MPMYAFALVVADGPLDELELAGSVDVRVKQARDGNHMSLRRMAGSYAEALLSVLSALPDPVAGRVVRVEHAGLATLEDIAARLGRTADELRLLGVEVVPVVDAASPDHEHRGSRRSLWDVANWLAENRAETALRETLNREVAVTEAANLALALRARIRQLHADDRHAVEGWLQATLRG